MEGQLCLKSLQDICGIGNQISECPCFSNQENRSGKPYNFFIPSFQRGYRWTQLQVEQLIKDLKDFHEDSNKKPTDWYCLQPLVVIRDDTNNRWIVIDGQQRLTTLFLILKCLGEDEIYSLDYETRKNSSKFLQNIDEKTDGDASTNPDFYCIFQNWHTINAKLKSYAHKLDLANTILTRTKFIWYKTSGNPYDEFSRLNSGRISLSNAELIKALLLKETLHDGKRSLPQQEAAREWDYMEQMLHDDDFWCFINPVPSAKRFNATRLDFIFEMVLRKNGHNNKYLQAYLENQKKSEITNETQEEVHQKLELSEQLEKQYFIFGVFQDYCKEPKRAIEIWKDVQGVFRRIHSWYADRNLFHRIGYLMNRNGLSPEEKLGQLADWLVSAETKQKPDLQKTLDERINVAALLGSLGALTYGKAPDEKKLKDILLLFNIAIMMRQRQENSRYPFREHKKATWTLEHIHAKNERSLIPQDVRMIALLLGLKLEGKKTDELVLDINKEFQNGGVIDSEGNSVPRIEPTPDSACDAGWKLIDEKDIHGIENLALLGHKANATFNNSLFLEKRAILAQWEKNEREKSSSSPPAQPSASQSSDLCPTDLCLKDYGFDQVEFVPVGTKMVFFKHFSPKITWPFLWTESDGENYVTTIRETLQKEFSPKSNDAQGIGK